MNTFDIYLKGGQVVTVETAHSWKEIMEYAFFEDERDILLTFNDITIVKSHISSIRNVTKKRAEAPIAERVDSSTPDWLANTIPAPYKPWEEEK